MKKAVILEISYTKKQENSKMNAGLDDYKLSCELFGHSMDVRAVATNAAKDDDNSIIYSGSRDKTVKVWKRAG